jgi:hypothetical protein
LWGTTDVECAESGALRVLHQEFLDEMSLDVSVYDGA